MGIRDRGGALLTVVLVFGVGMRSMSAITETLNLGSFFTKSFWYSGGSYAETSSGINWETIVFVAGMMIMVEGMARVGFFRWLCMRLAKLVKYQVIPCRLYTSGSGPSRHIACRKEDYV